MQDFRKLIVWQKAHKLVLNVYAKTAHFPKTEAFGLTAQTRRAAVSIPSNIAEGCGRGGDRELARFLWISLGSASELEYLSILIRDLMLLERVEALKLEAAAVEVKKMLTGLIATLPTDN